jgi:hypothetical protein
MPLAIFRRAKAKVIKQALGQGHRIAISEQTAAGTVAADVIGINCFLGAIWGNSSAGGVEVLAIIYRDVREAVAVGEGFSLVTAELADGC